MSETEEHKPLAIASTLTAGGKAVGIIPQTFDDCYRMAKLLAISGLVPDHFKNKPEAACVAILQGLEVGLAPMAALQSIAVINGRPSLWGDGALAVVRASGLLDAFEETDDGATATCRVARKGQGELVRTFSVEDAKKAGLAGKTGPWTQYPRRMRQMRARSWALRDGFADVLKGLHIAEEAQDIPMKDITPPSLPQIQRNSSAEGKRDGSVKIFNGLRKEILESGGPIECQAAWVKHKEWLTTVYRAWFDTLAEDFVVKMKDHGVEVDVDEYGWPILPQAEEEAA